MDAGLGRAEFRTVRRAVKAGEACPTDVEENAMEQLGRDLSNRVGVTD